MTEDEMVRWHHQLDGHEFEQTPGVDDRLGGLAYCGPWGLKESDMTERLNCLVGNKSYISKMALVTDQTFSILGALEAAIRQRNRKRNAWLIRVVGEKVGKEICLERAFNTISTRWQ